MHTEDLSTAGSRSHAATIMSGTVPLLFLFLLTSGIQTGCSGMSPQRIEEAEMEAIHEIEALLDAQGADWSRGDVESFTSIYSDDCTYISGSEITQGRNALTQRYRRRYPGAEAMGILKLEIIEMRPAYVTSRPLFGLLKSEDIGGMSIIARWTLSYPDRESATGLTLIVFRRSGEGWRIVQDASM